MSKKLIFLFPLLLFLTACGDGYIKDNFCGKHINFQYCKCAFHGDFCDNIGMDKGQAKDYVYDEYDKWVLEEAGEMEISEEDTEEVNNEEEGECKYDSDCDPICEENIAWKMGCNARTNVCEKTFDTDCSADVEVFANLDFGKICVDGQCVRDTKTIDAARANLQNEKEIWSNTVKKINATRADINVAMLDANKNCINGIADMTNLAIVEFATRVGSILAGGIPDIAKMTASAADAASGLLQESTKNLSSAAVDYAGFGLQKLYDYQQGIPTEENKKLKPHEYIKLNCDLYEYFKGLEAETATDLQTALDEANAVDEMLNALP